MSFDKEYFINNNYASYLERKERYERLVEELHYDLLKKIKLDFSEQVVIDWGCAVGFVVHGFKKIGFKSVCGYDVSEWAIKWGHENLGLSHHITNDLTKILPIKNCALMTALDVFEHMTLEDINWMLKKLQPKHVLVRIPLAKEDGGKYHLDVSERDQTHVTRLTKSSWIKTLKDLGYELMFDVNLGLIYDTSGVMCSMFKRST